MKHVNVTLWVRGRQLSSPTRSKVSHQVGSRTEGRSLRGGVRSCGKARTQAASLNSEKCIMVDHRISPGNRTQSRRCASFGRQQSCPRQGERAGHHRGLRAGHVFTGGTRELGRAICLLDDMPGLGDRVTKGPGAVWALRPDSAPCGDTTNARSTQGIGKRATSEATRDGSDGSLSGA